LANHSSNIFLEKRVASGGKLVWSKICIRIYGHTRMMMDEQCFPHVLGFYPKRRRRSSSGVLVHIGCPPTMGQTYDVLLENMGRTNGLPI
jgi:hypothetical protein